MVNALNSVDDLMLRAQRLAQTGDLAGAAHVLRSIVGRKPPNFQALFMLGTLESHLGHFSEAERHLHRAVDANPRSPEALISYGNALLEQKKPAHAIKALNKALSLQPGNA